MRNRIITGFVLAMAVATSAFAESPFIGKWTATAEAPTGPASEIVTVEKIKDGYSVSSKLVAPTPGQPEAGPGKDIMLAGDQFAYKRVVNIGGNDIVITYTGVVSGDKFTGTVDIGGFAKMPFNGVRIKEEVPAEEEPGAGLHGA